MCVVVLCAPIIIFLLMWTSRSGKSSFWSPSLICISYLQYYNLEVGCLSLYSGHFPTSFSQVVGVGMFDQVLSSSWYSLETGHLPLFSLPLAIWLQAQAIPCHSICSCLYTSKVTFILCWQPMDKPSLCCQCSASLWDAASHLVVVIGEGIL